MPIPVVDRERCIGCLTCIFLCPDEFRLGPDAKSEVTGEDSTCDIRAVADSCPVGAISVILAGEE